ncbi:MAG: HAD hydrolase-like protein, partial [Desulfobacterales bacterium]|nr:HAD hydrolase-like protein [Desulfobacterales bacterium]
MHNSSPPWLEILNPQVKTGKVRYALFDFDGTISVIRRGWETIMSALMLESIGGGNPLPAAVEAEVNAYIDRSTGILTILQMHWLAEAVRRHGLVEKPLNAAEYKRIYNERLLQPVRARLSRLNGSPAEREKLMIAGANAFLGELSARGVRLFLASGSDHEYVVQEAETLGVLDYFEGRVFGAKGDSVTDSKELVIARILDENPLQGEELLVVGDGPVEIRCARSVGAIA